MKIRIPEISKNGCIKFYRWEFDRLKQLTNTEYRLYLFYRQAVRWDPTKAGFGTILISYQALRNRYFDIPGWSKTTIQVAHDGLIKKGFIRRDKDDFIHVENMRMFQSTVRLAHQMFNLLVQGVQPTEANVQLAEQIDSNNLQKSIQDLAQKKTIPPIDVPPDEHSAV